MTKLQYERFDHLVTNCHTTLHDPKWVAMEITRADMRAIIAVYNELQEYSHKEDLAHDAKVMAAEAKREKAQSPPVTYSTRAEKA
jgi:hypothetical protein